LATEGNRNTALEIPILAQVDEVRPTSYSDIFHKVGNPALANVSEPIGWTVQSTDRHRLGSRWFAPVVLVVTLLAASVTTAEAATEYEDLAYGPNLPGNLLDLYIPDAPAPDLPLVIWHSGSAWASNTGKDTVVAEAVAQAFTNRGYAVATISMRSSIDARFPAQGHDTRAAIRWLRENAGTYGIDPNRFAFMGTSSGGWAATFAATTGDILELPGELGVNGTSSAIQVAVALFPPTDFLSMDTFAAANGLPMGNAYPHDGTTSPEGLLIQCPGEPAPVLPAEPLFNPGLVSIQDCPGETEAADPRSYIQGNEVPMWVMHGLADPLVPFNQSGLVYLATTAEGNEARLTIVPGGSHSHGSILNAASATTWSTSPGGQESMVQGSGPTLNDIDDFLRLRLP